MSPKVPPNFELTRTTPTFDKDTVPSGLLAAHRVAEGVWGRLVVHSGQVTFVFEDALDTPAVVAEGGHVDIPPARLHHIEIDQAATFAVEFYRPAADSGDRSTGLESTGLAGESDIAGGGGNPM